MTEELKQKIIAYYTQYYRDDCSLKDWEKRVEDRLNEEHSELIKMQKLQQLLGLKFHNQKHFICGAGTGGLGVVLHRNFNCDVYGIEPSNQEFEIIQDKCQDVGIDPTHFRREFGEKISFADNEFDFVHCYTVLEHVQDISECINEMIRITKPGGRIYIHTPNYSYPYEPHYKIVFPTFLPKFFGRYYLRLLGKSPIFLNTVNYITERYTNKILAKKNKIYWFRMYHSLEEVSKGRFSKLFNYLKVKKFIYPHQEILIIKLSA